MVLASIKIQEAEDDLVSVAHKVPIKLHPFIRFSAFSPLCSVDWNKRGKAFYLKLLTVCIDRDNKETHGSFNGIVRNHFMTSYTAFFFELSNVQTGNWEIPSSAPRDCCSLERHKIKCLLVRTQLWVSHFGINAPYSSACLSA